MHTPSSARRPGPDADGSAAGASRPRGRAETPEQRADRNFAELLQGLRVLLPGVQVLFAFLLTLPFSNGYARMTTAHRWMFFAATAGAALASVCFIAPAAQHRMLFRQGRKEMLVRRSNIYGIMGACALGGSMVAATLLVVDMVFGHPLAAVSAAVLALAAAWAWFVQPMITRWRGGPAR